jgi:hypothetical protein
MVLGTGNWIYGKDYTPENAVSVKLTSEKRSGYGTLALQESKIRREWIARRQPIIGFCRRSPRTGSSQSTMYCILQGRWSGVDETRTIDVDLFTLLKHKSLVEEGPMSHLSRRTLTHSEQQVFPPHH